MVLVVVVVVVVVGWHFFGYTIIPIWVELCGSRFNHNSFVICSWLIGFFFLYKLKV